MINPKCEKCDRHILPMRADSEGSAHVMLMTLVQFISPPPPALMPLESASTSFALCAPCLESGFNLELSSLSFEQMVAQEEADQVELKN